VSDLTEPTWTPPDQTPNPPQLQGAVARMALDPMSYALAAGCRRALQVGVPPVIIIEMLLNHLCSVVALVEPPGSREATIQDLVRSFAPLVNKHVDAKSTSPGGVILPRR
jgi:hypothetical protein